MITSALFNSHVTNSGRHAPRHQQQWRQGHQRSRAQTSRLTRAARDQVKTELECPWASRGTFDGRTNRPTRFSRPRLALGVARTDLPSAFRRAVSPLTRSPCPPLPPARAPAPMSSPHSHHNHRSRACSRSRACGSPMISRRMSCCGWRALRGWVTWGKEWWGSMC